MMVVKSYDTVTTNSRNHLVAVLRQVACSLYLQPVGGGGVAVVVVVVVVVLLLLLCFLLVRTYYPTGRDRFASL